MIEVGGFFDDELMKCDCFSFGECDCIKFVVVKCFECEWVNLVDDVGDCFREDLDFFLCMRVEME